METGIANMFETIDDIVEGTNLLNNWQRRPKNCADILDLPPLKRENGSFVGLKNQGATCYLNSVLQSYFMSPDFRQYILSMPLCKGDVKTKTDLITHE